MNIQEFLAEISDALMTQAVRLSDQGHNNAAARIARAAMACLEDPPEKSYAEHVTGLLETAETVEAVSGCVTLAQRLCPEVEEQCLAVLRCMTGERH